MFNPGKALGRAALGSLFIATGYSHIKDPEHLEGAVEPAAEKYLGGKDKLPLSPKQAVQAYGAVSLAAGTMLAMGKFKRLSATALVGCMAVNTLTGHPFWEETDPEKKQGQQIQFMKNLAITGGLLMQVFDIPPIPHVNRGEINLPDIDVAGAVDSVQSKLSDISLPGQQKGLRAKLPF